MSQLGIGARLPRLEDDRFLEGRAQFCADIAIPGTLHAAFVRSPHAHARIVSTRKPAGFEKRVYFADDLVGVGKLRSTAKMPGFKPSDWPILAKGKVRHVGEPVALVIGTTPAEAEDIATLVEMEFEPLPPVVSMAEALQKNRPFVHEEWGDNILVDIKLEAGDLAAAKAAAAHVVERSFRMNRMHPLPLEGRACIANYELEAGRTGRLRCKSASGSAADRPVTGSRHQPAPAARRRSRHRSVVWAENLSRKRNCVRRLGCYAAAASRPLDSRPL